MCFIFLQIISIYLYSAALLKYLNITVETIKNYLLLALCSDPQFQLLSLEGLLLFSLMSFWRRLLNQTVIIFGFFFPLDRIDVIRIWERTTPVISATNTKTDILMCMCMMLQAGSVITCKTSCWYLCLSCWMVSEGLAPRTAYRSFSAASFITAQTHRSITQTSNKSNDLSSNTYTTASLCLHIS